MSNIYDIYEKAIGNTAGWVLIKDGVVKGKVVFRYPRDGMGKLWAYVHFFGLRMERGSCSGCGYDKHPFAVRNALQKIQPVERYEHGNKEYYEETDKEIARIVEAFNKYDGNSFDNTFRDLGYTCQRVV